MKRAALVQASVSLFRTLQRAELEDLKSLGAFRVGPNSVEGKYFWTTREDAAWFARRLSARYGEGPSWIVEVLLDPLPRQRWRTIVPISARSDTSMRTSWTGSMTS